jgi:hypothetical protein
MNHFQLGGLGVLTGPSFIGAHKIFEMFIHLCKSPEMAPLGRPLKAIISGALKQGRRDTSPPN